MMITNTEMTNWIIEKFSGSGSVAQLVEQRTSNPKVVGSNPTWATEFFNNSVGHFSVGYHHWCCPEDGSNIES